MAANSETASPSITLYALQTCGHCKNIKQLLAARGLAFKTIYVDMLVGDERNDTMRLIKRINPSISFPTLQVGDRTIVGFKKEEIEKALDAENGG